LSLALTESLLGAKTALIKNKGGVGDLFAFAAIGSICRSSKAAYPAINKPAIMIKL
jgi:hypothetical protein